MSKSQGDRRKLGWLAAGLLLTVLSSPAWGLDLDREIAQNEIDSAQILSTLGRSNASVDRSEKKSDRKLQVQLIKRVKRHKRR
jgi:hypothetical protein